MSASNLPNSYAYIYEFHSIAKPNLIVRCIPRDVLDVKKTKTMCHHSKLGNLTKIYIN